MMMHIDYMIKKILRYESLQYKYPSAFGFQFSLDPKTGVKRSDFLNLILVFHIRLQIAMASSADCIHFPDLPECQTLFYYAFDQDYALVLLLLAFGFAFILSFAVGANDSANSWGTPVGAGTISLGIAYMLGSIMETIGATFLSEKVISGVSGKTSIINMDLYRSNETAEIINWANGTDEYLMPERQLMLGCVISMIASQTWQLIATYLGWPVSGTHAIISSEMGFTLAENGGNGVNIGEPQFIHASGIYKVVYGLIIAPILGFTVSFLFYLPL